MQSASFSWAPGQGAAVLVTVAASEGSVPRGAGTRMLVSTDSFAGTIGGGHLELRAIEIARAMLGEAGPPRLERFPLGPSLGQCCGGVVHLVFEQLGAADAALMHARRHIDSWRVLDLDSGAVWLLDGDGALLSGETAPAFDRARGSHLLQHAGRRFLVTAIKAPRERLVLFGAGHVGAALVRVLADLPCTVSWVDEREDLFPSQLPANVTMVATDAPEDAVAAAPAGACYLVMTHSHALDQRIVEAVLARPQVAWCGLIGSKTKRMQFEHRLHARAIDPQRIAALACPIGLPGIAGKEPAVIAVAVAAQLLMLWEAGAQACATIAPGTLEQERP